MTRTVACVMSLALGFLGLQAPASAQQAAARGGVVIAAPTDLDRAVLDVLNVTRYSVQSFAVPEENLDPWSAQVMLDGRTFVLDIRPHSVRSDYFRVLVQGEDGVLRQVEAPPIRTVKGEVRGIPGSSVRGTLVDGGVELVVRFDDGTSYGIQPQSEVDANAPHGAHIVYNGLDIRDTGGVCGGAVVGPDRVDDSGHAPGLVLRGVANKVCEIAVDSDFEFYTGRGSSVVNCVNEIEATMNGVESIYEINTGVTFEVTTIVVRTTTDDPYSGTDSSALLNQVGTEWAMSLYTPIRKDLVHLMTGRTMASGVLGIAWLSVVCGGSRYGLSQRLTNVQQRYAVVAHEVGHNFSADHCNSTCSPCQIMCAGLGGCSGVLTSFSTCEATGIAAYADSRPVPSCLTIEPSPFTPPFSDAFPSATLDATKWIYNRGAAISTAGVNEPSAPNSLQLNSAGTGLYQTDEIRTHFIQMAGVSTPILRYSTQKRGVPAGGQLIVEVWTSQLRWVVKNTLTSDGTDDGSYTVQTHTLSGVELHNEFRVQFRVVGLTSTSQNWYIDDVYVGTNTGAPTGACCVSGVCTVTTQAACTGTWTNGGECTPNPCAQPTGACCYPTNTACFVLPQAQCVAEGGTFQGFGSTCAVVSCPGPTGACCYPGTTLCFVMSQAQCNAESGEFQGMATNCSPNLCPPPTGACCFSNGSCQVISAADCTLLGGEFQEIDAPCNVDTCAVQTGACCRPAGCIVVSAADCASQSGTFIGIGTVCGVNTCVPETGACCVGSICVVVTSSACTGQGGSYRGANTACNQPGNNTQPCCRADFDLNGFVQVPDIFAFLSAWFAQNASADFDRNGTTEVPDIFAFLSAWFAGCGG